MKCLKMKKGNNVAIGWNTSIYLSSLIDTAMVLLLLNRLYKFTHLCYHSISWVCLQWKNYILWISCINNVFITGKRHFPRSPFAHLIFCIKTSLTQNIRCKFICAYKQIWRKYIYRILYICYNYYAIVYDFLMKGSV